MSATSIELTAWQRAVEGIEEEYAVGGKVMRRRRYSEGLLRMLLQGSNPGKYGPRPGFKRKRLLKHERKTIEREVRAEIASKRPSFDEAVESLADRLRVIVPEENRRKIAAGWTRLEEGGWLPPGYGPIVGWRDPDEVDGDAGDPPHDSM